MKTTFNAKTLWTIVLVACILGFGSASAQHQTVTVQTVQIQQARMSTAQKQAYDLENQALQTVVISAHKIK